MKNSNYQFKTIRVIFMIIFSGISMLLPAQSNSDGSLPQYLFPQFNNSTVIMKNGQRQNTKMNYNLVTEKMVYEQDGKFYDLIMLTTIDTVNILNRQFIPVGNVFYELVLQGNPLTLFIQQKGTLVAAGAPAAYGGTSQVSSSKYMSSVELSGGRYNLPLPADYSVNLSPVYWIRNGNEMFSFLNEKQFIKIFPDKEKELKLFIKQNRIKISNPDQLLKLVSYCNQLVK